MQRFFLDLKFNGENPTQDEEGSLHSDLATAQIEAVRALTDLSKEMVASDRLTNLLAVIVRDEVGPVLKATLHFELQRLG